MDCPLPPFELAAELATADELLADARRLGFPATRRLLTDWVGEGLLDHPTRRSLGQGNGSAKALWSVQQRNLFRVLVARRPASKTIRPLQEIVITLWMRSPLVGRELVPTSQVARAVARWASRQVTRDDARQLASQLLEVFGPVKKRSSLVGDVASYIYNRMYNSSTDEQCLAEIVERAYDDKDLKVPWCDRTVRPATYAYYLSVRIRGMERAKRGPSIESLELARIAYYQSRKEFLDSVQKSGYPADVMLPDEATIRSLTRELITMLGLAEEGSQQDGPAPSVTEAADDRDPAGTRSRLVANGPVRFASASRKGPRPPRVGSGDSTASA